MKNKYLYKITTLLLFALTACEGSFTQRMDKISGTINKVDSASEKFAKGVSKFSKTLEGYVDTTQYKKDSTGIWQKKSDTLN
jgi:hypothetical protein